MSRIPHIKNEDRPWASVQDGQRYRSYCHGFSTKKRKLSSNHWTIYRRIILFSFVWVWNDYMSPYLYISDVHRQMLSVGIKLFAAGQAQDYGAQMAASSLVLLPVLLAFFCCQSHFIEGLTAGAVKG